MDYVIENDVPLPNRVLQNALCKCISSLEISQSVFVEKTSRQYANESIRKVKKFSAGKKFTCSAINGGVRIWRID